MKHLELIVKVDAPAAFVWNAITDWPRQGEWMFATTVKQTSPGANQVGTTIAAFTGFGKLGFLDTMTVTSWEPPHVCDVIHTGRVVRGTGRFEVRSITETTSEFVWSEDLVLPLGAVGRFGFVFVQPFFLAGIRQSLNKFAQQTAREFVQKTTSN